MCRPSNIILHNRAPILAEAMLNNNSDPTTTATLNLKNDIRQPAIKEEKITLSPKDNYDDNTYAKKSWWQFETLLDSSRNNHEDIDDCPQFLSLPKDHKPFSTFNHHSFFSSDGKKMDHSKNDNTDRDKEGVSNKIVLPNISNSTLPYQKKHRHHPNRCPLYEAFELKRVLIPSELYLPTL